MRGGRNGSISQLEKQYQLEQEVLIVVLLGNGLGPTIHLDPVGKNLHQKRRESKVNLVRFPPSRRYAVILKLQF